MDRPVCGKCGLEMTRDNSQLRPELFLHDDCLPEGIKPVIIKPFTGEPPTPPPVNYYACLELRDYFAGQALAGLLASGAPMPNSKSDPHEVTAIAAYAMADAMIRERKEKA